MTYRLHPASGVIDLADGAHIKPVKSDPRWLAYRQWVKAGNVPLLPEPDIEPIEALRERVHSRIKQWRDAQERASIVFEHAGRMWDGGLAVRIRLQPVLGLPALPSGFFWTDANNSDVPMALADLAALDAAHEQAIVAQGWAIHARQRQMKTEIAGLDRAGLETYVIGWEDAP